MNKYVLSALTALCTSLLTVTSALAAQQVGVAWIGKSGMANNVLSGVNDRLSEIAPDIQLHIRTELSDVDALAAEISAFESENMDGMIILRSNGAVHLANNPPNIPAFIGGANHPVMLGTIADMNAPGGNVTGVTYFVDPELSLDSFVLLAPEVTSFLLVSQTNYSSSAIDGEMTMRACGSMGYTCGQVFANGAEEVAQVVAENIDGYDAVILGNQSGVFAHAQNALQAANGKPVFSYAKNGVEAGALGGLIADDHTLGEMLADRLVSVVKDGQNASGVAIGTDSNPTLFVNLTTAEQLGMASALAAAGGAVIIE